MRRQACIIAPPARVSRSCQKCGRLQVDSCLRARYVLMSKAPKISKLDDLLPALRDAGDTGLTLGAIRARFAGKTAGRASAPVRQLQEKLTALVEEGAVWGPFRHEGAQHYFALGRGPSVDSTRAEISRIAQDSPTRPLSRAQLADRLSARNRRFLPAAIRQAVANRELLEIPCGRFRCYLHRVVAAAYFGFECTAAAPALLNGHANGHGNGHANGHADGPSNGHARLTLEDLLPIYERLRAEQSGFSAVRIFDLMKALNLPKEVLHPLLIEEARTGRISIHHITSVELSAEVLEAGIRLPGFAEPFVTVIVKA
jgi:hypothetical protein